MPAVLSKDDGSIDWKKVALITGSVALVSYIGYRILSSGNDKPKQRPGPGKSGDVLASTSLSSAAQVDRTMSDADLSDLAPLEQAVALKNRGNKYFKGGNYEKAVSCYSDAIERCPPKNKQELSTFYQNRAAANENLRKNDDSILDCSSALELEPSYLKAMTRRARLFENSNRLKDCLEDVTAACIIECFKNTGTLEWADRVLKALGEKLSKEELKKMIPKLPSQAFLRTYFSSFAYDPFLNPIGPPDGHEDTEGEKDDSEKSEGELALDEAIAAFRDEKFKSVLALADKAVQYLEKSSDSRLSDALLLRGTFRLLHGQSDQAEEDLERVASCKDASNEARISALIRKGSLVMTTRSNVEESLNEFNRALNLSRENSDIFHHRGQLYLICNRIDEALADLNKAASLSPEFSIAQAQKAYAGYRAAQMKQDIAKMQVRVQDFEQLTTNYPKCIETHSLYSQVLVDLGRYDEADKHFRIITETEPHSGTAYVHRGLLLLQWKQDVDGAIQLMKKGIDMDPLCEFAHETLATVYVQRGNFDDALTLFARGIELCRSQNEMAHLISLREAVLAQERVCVRLGMSVHDMIQKNMRSLHGTGMAGIPV